MIKNNEGKVAVKYHQASSTFVPSGNPSYGFLFQVRNNISIGWIDEKHVPTVLNIRANCLTCPPNPYKLAIQGEVDKWYGADTSNI